MVAADYVSEGIAFGNGSDAVMLWKDEVADEVAYDNGETFPDSERRGDEPLPERLRRGEQR